MFSPARVAKQPEPLEISTNDYWLDEAQFTTILREKTRTSGGSEQEISGGGR